MRGLRGPTTARCHTTSKIQTLPGSPPQAYAAGRCHLPLPLTPSIPYPTPMPTHTRPTTPRIHPTIRRSCTGRACPCEGRGTPPPVKGESRGGTPLFLGAASRSGGCAPSYEKYLRGRAGGPNQRRNAGSSSPPAPALFPFVDFAPFFTGAAGPRSARALADTTCPPFSTVSTPPSGALGPSSGPCLADTTCPPLSTCPSRLKPKLESVSSGTEEGKKMRSTIQSNSDRPPALTALLAGCYRLPGTPLEGRTSHGR